MTVQPSLFEARARRTDPATSHLAALSVGQGATSVVLDTFRRAPHGLCDDEMCAAVTADVHRWATLKSARSRLSAAGWLIDSGLRRPSVRGREQTVWLYREQT